AQRLEVTRPLVVVCQEKPLNPAVLERALDRLVAAAGVELRLIVAATDVQPEQHARMATDDRVVHLDAGVDESIGIASSLDVPGAQLGLSKSPLLRRVDLSV